MRALILLSLVLAACAVTPTAAGDGLPVLGIDVGQVGVTVPAGTDRYVTIDEGKWTVVERIARNGGRVLGFTRVKGHFTIPAVAYDGSASGLSADGSTLVLIEPRKSFPRAATRFAYLTTPGLALYRTITLRGDFSFDAISPRGRTMFLVNYTNPRDPTRYSVRAFDLLLSRLLPKPVTDPAEHENAMRGAPINRLMSADGRWAYTLYDGAGKTPFVHALDTANRRARCIDLAMLSGRKDLWSLRLHRDGPGSNLRVDSFRGPVAVVDTTTFTAGLPQAPASRDLRPWTIAGGAAVAVLLLGLAGVATRRRFRGRPAPA